MGLGMGCLYACAPLTLIASILLFMLAVMLRSGNWTFEVLAAKHDWDRSAKSRVCRNGGIIYLCISAVLWVLVLLDSFLLQLEKIPNAVAVLFRERRLPRWRELRRSYRKTTTSGLARASPAVDVVVTALSAAPAVLQGAGGTEPHTVGDESRALLGQQPPSSSGGSALGEGMAASPLTGQAHPIPHLAPSA